ncbi:MAG: chemotaxis protein CheA [Lachnospiraceae bacterium]|nr:chemotaxis protein CheA [Lachnospiraceae bacterium]
MDVSQYLEMFIDESKEHIQTLSDQLMILEKEHDNVDTINEIFRAAHSLKGMAGTMGYKRMQRLTHDMENVFQEIRSDNMKVEPELVDVLFDGLDAISSYLDNIIESADEGTEDNEDIINALNSIVEKATGKGSQEDENKTDSDSSSNVSESSESVVSESENNSKVEDKAPEDGENFRKIKLSDFEKKSFREVLLEEDGSILLGITVFLSESCILKSARSFLVFKVLEEHGEVLKSSPSVQDIEDEKFDLDFSVLYLSNLPAEDIKAAIANVSEVEKVYVSVCDDMIDNFDPNDTNKPSDKETPDIDKKEESNETSDKGSDSDDNVDKKGENTENKSVGGAAAAVKVQEKSKSKSSKPNIGRTVRVDIEKLDDLMNLVSELIIAKNGLVSISAEKLSGDPNNNAINEQIEYLESVTTNLHESVMKVRMVPIETIFSRFPRMVRDLSKKLNKKIEFHVSGGETELDRTVIDEIGDPLQHLLRNAADHGLEDEETRKAAGKDETGNIYLNAYQVGNNIVIEVKDDGAGMDIEKIKRKGIEKGIITQEMADMMPDDEAIDLLFRPSFSTSEEITDISGRGVGLDVVKTKIEELGGSIECRSELNEGSTFIIKLPLTLAIIQTLMVQLGNEKYAIPLGNIQTIEDIPLDSIRHVQGKEVINLRGRVIPLLRLDSLLDVPDVGYIPESLMVVIVEKGDKVAGLVVDNLIGQQESVIKPIGDYINASRSIGGATILGNGEIALILEVNALF